MNAGGELSAFGQVILVDLVLAGDNAVVIGALAANLPDKQRKTAVLLGTIGAVALRILLSLGAVWLLLIPGIMAIGGALLFWVAWKMWKDLAAAEAHSANSIGTPEALHKVVWAIVVADLSMSLDNVLGVAGAAVGHPLALVFGLLLSVVLMMVGATLIANVINRYRWIAYLGLALILFIAVRMVWHDVATLL